MTFVLTLTPYRRCRPVVLALIIGLHAGVLAYATLVKPIAVVVPEIAPVAMMSLLAQPSVKASVQTSMPIPVTRSATQPKVALPPKPRIVKTPPLKTVLKPVVKTIDTPRPASPPTPTQTAESPKMVEPAANVPSDQSSSSSAAQIQSAAAASMAAQVETASPPSFSAAYLDNPPPVYPPLARRMGEEGRVLLRVYVTPQGRAGEVKILTSSGSAMFDDAAQVAVKAWRFVPARQGDNAVAAWVQVPIVFKLS